MHIYFPYLDPDTGYTDAQFFDWVVDPSLNKDKLNRFEQLGIQIVFVSDPDTAASDLKKSLSTPGAIVIYFGHTVGKGLNPHGPPKKKPSITGADLTALLNAATAKIVVLAGCATDGCVRRVKGDIVVIVTRSGNDQVTNTLQWAPAVKAFLDKLMSGGTAGDALAAANKAFAKASSTDDFAMISGDATLKLF